MMHISDNQSVEEFREKDLMLIATNDILIDESNGIYLSGVDSSFEKVTWILGQYDDIVDAVQEFNAVDLNCTISRGYPPISTPDAICQVMLLDDVGAIAEQFSGEMAVRDSVFSTEEYDYML